jgi:hypothetical protein
MGMPPPFGGFKPHHRHHHRHHGHKGKHGKMVPPPFQMPYFFNPYGTNMQYGPESPNLTFGQEDFPTELEEYDPNTMPNVADNEENDKINPNTSATFAEVAAADAAADEAEGKDPAAPSKEPVQQVVPGFDL